jgi:hypothetical protein
MTEDPRKIGLKNGLRQLTVEQLHRVLDYPNEMVLDTYNYYDGKFCPLAVALELDKMPEPSHDKVFQTLTSMGLNVYNTRGIPGEFYTTNRLEDLLTAVKEVLQEKKDQQCPCLLINKRCGPCSEGYHIFCNKIPHGNYEEAHQWFLDNPEATKEIIARDPILEQERIKSLEEINKKKNADQ